MKTIWKYPVEIGGVTEHRMPKGAAVLHVAMQGAHVTLWAEVDSDAPNETREFTVIGTGHFVPASSTWRGIAFDGPFVWHVYEHTA